MFLYTGLFTSVDNLVNSSWLRMLRELVNSMSCRLLSSRLPDRRYIHQLFPHSFAWYPEEIPNLFRMPAACFIQKKQHHPTYPHYSLYYSLSDSDDYSFL